MRSPAWAVPGDVPALPSDSGSPSSSMWELGASCSLLVLWAISWSLPHHELPQMLPARSCFPPLPRPCYSSFSASSFLLTHYSQDFLPRLVGEGGLSRRAEKAFALLPPSTSPSPAESLRLPAFTPYQNIPLHSQRPPTSCP